MVVCWKSVTYSSSSFSGVFGSGEIGSGFLACVTGCLCCFHRSQVNYELPPLECLNSLHSLYRKLLNLFAACFIHVQSTKRSTQQFNFDPGMCLWILIQYIQIRLINMSVRICSLCLQDFQR